MDNITRLKQNKAQVSFHKPILNKQKLQDSNIDLTRSIAMGFYGAGEYPMAEKMKRNIMERLNLSID